MRAHLPLTAEEQEWRDRWITEVPEVSPRARARLMGESVGDFPVHGFDVSSYQPAGPDFRQGGRQFAIFKATEGTGYFDPHFSANRGAAHAEGCRAVGLYHFARPGQHSPDAEAQWFLGHVGGRQGNEFAVLDYEVPPWNEAWIVRYVQVLQAAGWRVAFYSYAGMIGSNPTSQIVGATPHLWVAAYSATAPGSDRWPHWTLWQHTDGQYGSDDGPWDCSVAVPGLLDQLAQAGPAPAPPPSPVIQEEPVGAYALPVLEPGEGYTHRLLPSEHSGGIAFGAAFISFGADFGDPAIRPDAPVPLRIAVWDHNVNGWVVLFGGGSFDPSGKWVEDNSAVPPLYVPTVGDVRAIQFHAANTKISIVHCGKKGRVVPLIEYQAG